VHASGHDDNVTIAQLRSSRCRRCHVAVATCEHKSVQAGASAHEWSRPQHDDRTVAIVMLLSSPRGCCERVGVGRLGGQREGKGRGNVRTSVHDDAVTITIMSSSCHRHPNVAVARARAGVRCTCALGGRTRVRRQYTSGGGAGRACRKGGQGCAAVRAGEPCVSGGRARVRPN
jgi:hypothetical protein